MKKAMSLLICVLSATPLLMADGDGWGWGHHHHAPEMTLSAGVGALILIGGAILISRGRRKVKS